MHLLDHLRSEARRKLGARAERIDSFDLAQMVKNIATKDGLIFEAGDFALVQLSTAGPDHPAYSLRTESFSLIRAGSFVALPPDTPVPSHAYEVRLPSADTSSWEPADAWSDCSALCLSCIERTQLVADTWSGFGQIRDAVTHLAVGWVAVDGVVWRRGEAGEEILHTPSTRMFGR